MVIFKGTLEQKAWKAAAPTDWTIEKSKNGWTTDELGLKWLKEVFHPNAPSISGYRLLILDGHGSHITPEFDQFCMQNQIIPVCMPPHSSHLCQPLDVGCFSPLKRAYGAEISNLIERGTHHVDKIDFIQIYARIRHTVLNERNIQSGFRATGLVPYNPARVLDTLHASISTPTPPGSSHSNSSHSWTSATPKNVKQLARQSALFRKLMRHRTQSPPSPTLEAFNHLVKGCEILMYQHELQAREIRQLRAENARQKAKKKLPRGFVQTPNTSNTANSTEVVDGDGQMNTDPPGQPSRKRANPRCSGCNQEGHRINRCPNIQVSK